MFNIWHFHGFCLSSQKISIYLWINKMERDKFWDSLKFILISFVVYGHMIEIFAPDGSYNRAMYNFIYTFHMGFFLFISGRFSQVKDRKKYRKGIILLIETYIVFQIIRCFKVIMIGNTLNYVSGVIFPKGTMWYIGYLIMYRSFIYFTPQRIREHQCVIMILISFLLALFWGFVPVRTFQKLFAFFPYFLLGYYSIKIDIKSRIMRLPVYDAFAGIVIIFFLFYFLLNFDIGYIIYCHVSFFGDYTQISPFYLFIFRGLVYISAIIISIFIMRIALSYDVFPQLGKKTLFIYMYHSFIVLAFRFLITHGYIAGNEFLLIGYTIFIIVFLIVLSKVRFFNILMNPVSFLIEKVKAART